MSQLLQRFGPPVHVPALTDQSSHITLGAHQAALAETPAQHLAPQGHSELTFNPMGLVFPQSRAPLSSSSTLQEGASLYVVDIFPTREAAGIDFQVALACFEAELTGLSTPVGPISVEEVFAIHPIRPPRRTRHTELLPGANPHPEGCRFHISEMACRGSGDYTPRAWGNGGATFLLRTWTQGKAIHDHGWGDRHRNGPPQGRNQTVVRRLRSEDRGLPLLCEQPTVEQIKALDTVIKSGRPPPPSSVS